MNATAAAMKAMSQAMPQARHEGWTRTRIGRRQLFSRRIFEGEVFRIRVLAGHLWVTFEGSRKDYHLGESEIHRFHGPGLLVAEGIEDGAVLEIAQGRISSAAT